MRDLNNDVQHLFFEKNVHLIFEQDVSVVFVDITINLIVYLGTCTFLIFKVNHHDFNIYYIYMFDGFC